MHQTRLHFLQKEVTNISMELPLNAFALLLFRLHFDSHDFVSILNAWIPTGVY